MSTGGRRLLAWSVALALGAALLTWLFRVPASPSQVNRLIQAHLPKRATKAQVLGFLKSRGWPYEDVPADPAAKGDASEVQYGADSAVFSRIEGLGSRYFDLGHITVTFAFDKSARLIRYKVEDFGPDPL